MIFRKILKLMLSGLTRWALKKHQIKLYVVSGWHGTELSRELAYQVLSSHILVRRMTTNPWWDFSIPLAILGYSDKRRTPLAWAILMIKATYVLLFNKANPHVLILNVNYSDENTAKYWASFLNPSVLLITAFKESLPFIQHIVKVTKNAGGTIVCDMRDQTKMEVMTGQYENLYYFGHNCGKLHFDEVELGFVLFTYNNKKYRIKKNLFPGMKAEVMAGSLCLAILNDIEITDALYAMVKFQIPPTMIQRLIDNLNSLKK